MPLLESVWMVSEIWDQHVEIPLITTESVNSAIRNSIIGSIPLKIEMQ